jgi:hypothetical protein
LDKLIDDTEDLSVQTYKFKKKGIKLNNKIKVFNKIKKKKVNNKIKKKKGIK